MKWTPAHRERDGGTVPRRAMMGSLAVHGAIGVLAVVLTLGGPEPLEFETFQVQIVEAPPELQSETPSAEEIVIETPDPVAPEPIVDETPPPIVEEVVERPPEPEPEPAPVKPEPKPTPPTPEPDPTPPATPEEPEETSELSGAEVTVRMEGLQRDFPAYYQNIQRQIARCFRPPRAGTNLETTIYFEIRPDGTTANERFESRSGNAALDFGALAAIADCAGKNGSFGPLPDDLGWDRLPILFSFRPQGDPEPATR